MDSMSGEPLESMPMHAHVIAMARIRAGTVAEEPTNSPLAGHVHAGDGFAAMTVMTVDLSEATYVWLLTDPDMVQSVREVGNRQLFGVVKARGFCFGCLPDDDGKDALTLTDDEARDRGWIGE